MEAVLSTAGFPPLDFSLVGLAKCPGPKWVEFFQGQWESGIAKPVWSVSLAHSVASGRLIVLQTAPRQRWDREMGGEVEGELNSGRGPGEFAFDLLRQMIDSGRPTPEGEASLKGTERASYNKGLVTFAEEHGAEWETWEPARWSLGERSLDAKIFRFAHAWAGFSVDDPDRYIGVIAYHVANTTVRLDEVDGASYDFDFTEPFGIEDLQAQVGSRPDAESVVRAATRHPDHEAVMATPRRVIASTESRTSQARAV
jgi:hypothetical protein